MRSDRQDSRVDPDQGVYVEMEGIMEVRYVSEDVDYERDSEDFYHFQRRVREIPEDFCHKDRVTTEQAVFFCLVCNCDLKSLRPLRDHVTGNKHIRKACEKKRQIMGLPADPQNAPRIKKIKKEKPRVDVGLSLKQRLEDCGEPAIGLGFISEFLNPRNSRDPPMYTCKLEGCKSAWGTSDDMFNHVIKAKHQKNFFKMQNPTDSRIAGLSSADILIKAAEFEEEHGGCDERDYEAIRQVCDLERYTELRDRPDDWSEKKASLGLVGANMNPNTCPLGRRRGFGGGPDDRKKARPSSPPLFDPESWKDWRPVGREEVLEQFGKQARGGVRDVQDMVGEFRGEKGDEEYEDIKFYAGIYRDLLGVMEFDSEGAPGLLGDLARVAQELEDKVEREDRDMKNVSRLMMELEEEVTQYHSDRDTKKYANIKERLAEVTNLNKDLRPTREMNIKLKNDYNKRLTELWTGFESRSDSLAEQLESQMEVGSKSTSRLEDRKAAVDKYREEMIRFVMDYLGIEFRNNFRDEAELEMFADKTVREKVLEQEVNVFGKRGKAWSQFRVTNNTKESVKKYLTKKMKSYAKRATLS